MNDENSMNVLIYRLETIENELKSVKQLLIDVPLLNKNIEGAEDYLNRKIDNAEEKLNEKISNLEKRIDVIETNVDVLHKELSEVKAEPNKKAAGRFNYIADYIFKTVVGIVVAWLILQTGLGGAQ